MAKEKPKVQPKGKPPISKDPDSRIYVPESTRRAAGMKLGYLDPATKGKRIEVYRPYEGVTIPKAKPRTGHR